MSRMAALTLILVLTVGSGLLSGCSTETDAEPERVVVQHLLVSFRGKLPGKQVLRSQDEARSLASEILQQAQEGAEFDLLVKQHTDDQHPGIYAMANRGITPQGPDEYPRDGMVPGFGDVAFDLGAGEIAMCEYDDLKSPYGYHIIKRLE